MCVLSNVPVPLCGGCIALPLTVLTVIQFPKSNYGYRDSIVRKIGMSFKIHPGVLIQ